MAAFLHGQRFNETTFLQPGNRAIQSSGRESRPAHPLNVLRHGMTVLRPVRYTRQYEQRRIGKMAELEVRDYFALSITHHVVVVSQVGVECKFPDRRLRLTLTRQTAKLLLTGLRSPRNASRGP